MRVEQPAAFFDPAREHRAIVDGAGDDALSAVRRAFRRRHFRRQRIAGAGDATYSYFDPGGQYLGSVWWQVLIMDETGAIVGSSNSVLN